MKLEGIRVLDLSMFLPGPLLTQLMADHGAEVIKIETVDEGEPNREIGARRDGVTVFFANSHRNKKSLALNLKTEEGREIFLKLAEQADVVIEAFRPGVAKRLGVDYESVATRSPGIVYCSISAWGQDGPYVKMAAHDLTCEAIAGILSVNQGPDGKPAMPGLANADMLSCTLGLSGVLMALLRRQRTGKGDFLDMAMLDSLLACMPNNFGPPMAEKRPPEPKQERSWGGNAMYGIYETKDDRHIVLGAAEIKFATNLLTALGRPELIELCKLPPGKGQDPVREFFRATFRGKTQAEWVAWFAGRDIAFAPVKNLRQALDDPQVRAREMVVVDERGWEHIGNPIKFRNEPAELKFDLPAHGQHSEEIIRGLGYDERQLQAMRQRGVFVAHRWAKAAE
ncbi:MAG: CoA transferase [Alphaproteobacteria bacterium]|nr:CoA transferase [Alphaproteobacteria bacterium]